ncbi:MAG: hypothetical protein PVG65_06260 [Candidatus Thorarchaeota archaeon]|jgi:hypothetical protein
MKKTVSILMVLGLFVGGSLSSAQAQGTKTAFSLNLGVQTNFFGEDSFEHAWFTLDARFGIDVNQSLEISPEIMAAVDDSLEFDAVGLYPGVMLNLKKGDFFVGAGAVLPIIFDVVETQIYPPAPKVNFGYRAKYLILTAYFYTLTGEGFDIFEFNLIGATIGFRF